MITKIEIRPQMVGYRSTPDGIEEVFSDDFSLLLGNYGDGGKMRQIGYVWYKPRPRVTCECYTPTEDERLVIMDLVQQETGVLMEDAVIFPQPPEEDDEDEEEDDEDE